MNKIKKYIMQIFILLLPIIFAGHLIKLDYQNYFDFQKINMDFLSLVVNNTVIIFLYIFSLFAVENIQIKLNKNQEETAKKMFEETYKMIDIEFYLLRCYSMVNFFDNEMDWSDIELVNGFKNHFRDIPFKDDENLRELRKNGIIRNSDYENYTDIKSDFVEYINEYFKQDYDRKKVIQMKTRIEKKVKSARKALDIKENKK